MGVGKDSCDHRPDRLLVLFVASVYIYDQLSMPSGFWTDADRPRKLWKKLADSQEARQERRWSELWAAAKGDDKAKGKLPGRWRRAAGLSHQYLRPQSWRERFHRFPP